LLTHCISKIEACIDKNGLEINRKPCKKQFAEALEIMKEARAILLGEPVGSTDWQKGHMLSMDAPRVKSLMTFLSFKD